MMDANHALKSSTINAAAVAAAAGLGDRTGTLVVPVEPNGAADCDTPIPKQLTTQDEAYFVAALGLFTLPRLSELGYGSIENLSQHIEDGRLPACKFWGRYWLSLTEAGAAAGKDRGDVDDSVAGALVQLDAAMDGLSHQQRGRIASLLGGES